MDNNLLQEQHQRLLAKVAKMRFYQREYFAKRCSTDLKAAKNYEKEVDAIIKAEYQPTPSPQPKLF